METPKNKSQTKLTRTKSSLLRCSSPTNRSSIPSLGSVNEDNFFEEDEEDKNKKKNKNKKNNNSYKKNRFGSGSGSGLGSIRFVAVPILGFFSGCSFFFYVFYFSYIGSVGPTSENVLLILIFVAIALYLLNRNKRVIHRSISVLKHSWDGNLKRLGFCSQGSAKPVQWFIGETGTGSVDEKEKKGLGKEGVEFYSNGDFYEGEFHGGKCNGSGVYHYFGSGRYEGDWVDGKYDGYGIENWARGSRYKGYYRQGLRHGYGVYRFYTGDSYSGEWCNGQSHGFGVQSCSDGSCYVGEFKFGVKHGFGCYHFR
jgi:hypothetical protein